MDPPSSYNHKKDLDEGDPSSTLLDRTSFQPQDLDSAELPPELTNLKQQPYRFESTLSVLNNGFDELKSWKNEARLDEDVEEVVSASDREVLLSDDARLPHEQEGSGGSGERALDWGLGGGPNHIASIRFGFRGTELTNFLAQELGKFNSLVSISMLDVEKIRDSCPMDFYAQKLLDELLKKYVVMFPMDFYAHKLLDELLKKDVVMFLFLFLPLVNFNSFKRLMHEFHLHDFFTAYDEAYDSFGAISTSFCEADIGQAIAKDTRIPLISFTGYASVLKGSRFLKPAQQLLEELCDVGIRGVYGEKITADASLMETHSESLSASRTGVDDPLIGNGNHEGRKKKSRLLTMLGEVYRRYMEYYQQIHAVINSFEYVAGLGNAAPYASLTFTIPENDPIKAQFMEQQFQQEVMMMATLNRPNIARFIGACRKPLQIQPLVALRNFVIALGGILVGLVTSHAGCVADGIIGYCSNSLHYKVSRHIGFVSKLDQAYSSSVMEEEDQKRLDLLYEAEEEYSKELDLAVMLASDQGLLGVAANYSLGIIFLFFFSPLLC